ncbi:MAG: glycosyltransferase family 4 protein [Actinomycetota bacterium]|nr:glycosyltransferase family 4 protein [Actinomycetota bacterium]
MVICFISHHAGLYGAEGALLELIEALGDRGFDCRVLSPYPGPLFGELKKKGVPYSLIHCKWWADINPSGARRILRTFWNGILLPEVARKIKNWKCDLVFTNTAVLNEGAVAAAVLGLPHVWNIHEFGEEDHGLHFDLGEKVSGRFIDKFSSFVVCNSEAVKKKYARHVRPEKLKVVYQSVTAAEYAGADHYSSGKDYMLKCAVVGRLQPGKGQEDAIRAAGALRRAGAKIGLTIMGDGDPCYERFLKKVANDENVSKQVSFTGFVNDAFSRLHLMDAVLVCSRNEAFGRVTVEAMLAGKPVIGANSGGTAELLCDGFNGLLYTPGDHLDLAGKIHYLLQNKAEARQMGRNGWQWAKNRFTRERYGREIAQILEAACSNKKNCRLY